jgi:hypothetical protein
MADPQYSDLPAGAQVVSAPQTGSNPAQYSDVPQGSQVVQPSASGQPAAPQSDENITPEQYQQMSPQDRQAFDSRVRQNRSIADPITGFLKGAEDTASGVASLIHKIPIVGEKIIPSEGLTAMKKQATPTNPMETLGYGGETLTEFLLGDEALKGLSLAERLKQASGVAQIFEKSPRLMKAVQIGSEALRHGAVQTAQTLARTGDPGKALEEGTTMGATSAAMGGVGSVVTDALEKAGKLGKTLESAQAGEQAVKKVATGTEEVVPKAVATTKPVIAAPAEGIVPAHADIASAAKKGVDTVESAMHKTFDEGINKISSDLAGKTINLDESPLAQAAKQAQSALKQEPKGLTDRLGKSLQGLIPGTERGEKMVGTILGEAPKPASAQDAAWERLVGEMTGAAKTPAAAEPEKLTVDNLINYRQRLGKILPQMAYDDPNKQVIYKLLGGVDDSIQKMADESGNPDISDFYKNLREQYKDRVQFFNSSSAKAADNPVRYQVAQKLQSGTLDDAPKYLLGGNNSLAKVRAAKELLGQESVDNLAQQAIRRWSADAVSESGQLNAPKLISQWNRIPEATRNEFFSQANVGYQQMMKDLAEGEAVNPETKRKIANLVRFGIFPAIGAATGYVGGELTGAGGERSGYYGALAGALYGGGRREMANDLIDYLASHPQNFVRAGKVAEALNSPTAKQVGRVAKQQTARGLSNVMAGASQPLSEPAPIGEEQ